MPNNTSNKLTFIYFGEGIEQKLKEIESFLDSDERELDFNKIIPILGDLDNDTCREIWGTKWNSYSVSKVKSKNYSLTYFFQTAWSWPEPIINLIFAKFPGVYISFATACEGGWFARTMVKDDERDEIAVNEWTSDLGNDSGGSIRAAMLQALEV